MSIIQRRKLDGGLALPNFELYNWAFILRPWANWDDKDTVVSWREMEESLVSPHSLRDVVFSNIPIKQCFQRFGPIVTNLIAVWRRAEKLCDFTGKWHTRSPIFDNVKLLIGNKPIKKHPPWTSKGIHHLGDIFGEQGLYLFEHIKQRFELRNHHSWLFYLQLRDAMRTYGVPWGSALPPHPCIGCFLL